jgi:5-methylthioadenosine/S-adenosylhomocysteine deaminase
MAAARRLLVTRAKVLTDFAAAPDVKDILIENGIIADISSEQQDPPPDAKRLDAHGKLAIPGLVNAHYHSHDVLARGMFEDLALEGWIALAILPPVRVLTRREARLRTLLGAIDCLRNGITTVQDMLGCGPGAEEQVEAAIDAYNEVGIRCVLGLQVGNRAAIDCLPGMRERLPAALAPMLSAGASDVRRILDFVAAPLSRRFGGRLTFAIAPGSPQRCTFDLLCGLAELSARHRLPMVTHVNESKLQVFLARELYAEYGGSSLDYLNAAGALDQHLCMAHAIWLSAAEIDRIASAGASVVTCPTSNLKLKNGVAPLRMLKQAGVRVALGADNTSAGDAQNLFEAMKLVCNMSAGKGPARSALLAADALAMATTAGAQAIGLADRIGRIAVGMAADLALLDLSDPSYLPLNDAVRQIVYCESGRGVHTVIVDGEIVVEDRRVRTVDYDALLNEAAALHDAFARDAGAHAARMAPLLPYILDTVRAHARLPLPFDRWPSADDRLPDDGGA